jgi:hypothetical protein
MVIRTAMLSILVIAAGAQAQPPEGARGRGPGGLGPRLIGAEAGMPGRVVKNAPDSAESVTESTQTLPDGNHIKRTNSTRVYRDSEGRTRREQSLQNLNGLGGAASNSTQPQVAFINDPVAGANYALNLANRTATKSTWHGRGGAGAFGAPRDPNAPRAEHPAGSDGRFGGPGMPGGRGRNRQNVKTESLGKQTIEGVVAEGTRTTMTIPAGQVGNELPIQIVDEVWYSPDLQTAVLRKHTDPRSGESVTRYMNISRAEPSRMLFEPPADFKVAEPGRGRVKQ